MEKVITVNDASINTATIEVKVMKIGNRQVTLAVFRQLPSLDIIDPQTGELRGEPWGRVNYHIDCKHEGTHLHVVWQQGNELRHGIDIRDAFTYSPWRERKNTLADLVETYFAARILEGWKPDTLSLPTRFTFELEGEQMQAHLRSDVARPWGTYVDGGKYFHSEALEKIIQDYKLPMQSRKIVDEHILPLRSSLNEHKRKWAQSYARLEQLDQLFIAV